MATHMLYDLLAPEGRDGCHDYAAGYEAEDGCTYVRLTALLARRLGTAVTTTLFAARRLFAERATALPAKRWTAALRSCLRAWATRCTTTPLDWKYEDGWDFEDCCKVS